MSHPTSIPPTRTTRLSLQSTPSSIVPTPSTTGASNVPGGQMASAKPSSGTLARVLSTRPPTAILKGNAPETTEDNSRESQEPPIQVTAEHRKLLLRLGPLLQVEKSLASAIKADVTLTGAESNQIVSDETELNTRTPADIGNATREFFVRAGDDWKRGASTPNPSLSKNDSTSSLKSIASTESVASLRKQALQRVGLHRPRQTDTIVDQPLLRDALSNTRKQGSDVDSGGDKKIGRNDELERASSVLSACREDIVALWSDPVVRAILKRRRIDLESHPGL